MSTMNAIQQALEAKDIHFASTYEGMSVLLKSRKSSKSSATILIVDDSKEDRTLYKNWLEKTSSQPYRIVEADNSGLQSLQNMAPKMPIIFLTAYKNEAAAVEAIEEGAQDYIFKDKLDAALIRRAIQFAIIRKQFENELVVQANFDHLTGLANRLFFEDRLAITLAKLKRYGGNLGVLFLDLNRFKLINDTYGHAIGDRLLAEVGRRLKLCLRASDTPARLGGDEFAVLIEDAAAHERCSSVAQKLITSIEEPFSTSGIQLTVGVSIGIVTCTTGDQRTCADLIRQADEAMYEAKTEAASAYRFCLESPDSQQSVA